MRQTLFACALFFASSHAFAQAPTPAPETSEVDTSEVDTSEVDASEAEEPLDVADAETNVAAQEAAADTLPEETPADAPPAARAKFALVIVGDADAALQTRAAELNEALHDAGLTSVHDEAIQEALLGRGTEDDGLGPLRGARRTLALSDDAGARADALERIGRASGADTLVLLARRAPTLRVYDLTARSFYQAVPGSPDDVPYIASATRAAAARALTAPALVAEAAAEEPEVEVDADEDLPPVRAFFKKNWPYMVAGVLLAGAIIWLVVGAGSNDEAPPPVLRFRPGSAEDQ